ncbi:MAG: B12-binding domain-containing radical SAM protein [Candidatus Rokubacteria bacterium]|nr:B12-binding domain-containing radical SAM protein [Candidatus Rokubacteria bacterium]
MKVLFVERDVEYIDPMNIQLLSALAKQRGHSTFLSILSADDLDADLGRIKPDLVAFSAKTGEHTTYFRANERVKQYSPKIFTIMGGPHPTFFPGLIETHDFDAVGVGECDEGWQELLDALEAGRSIDAIPNIVTRANASKVLRATTRASELVQLAGAAASVRPEYDLEVDPTFLRPRRTVLDTLPFYDRELVYQKTHLARFPLRSFMSSRGCPFQCTYCFEPKFNVMYAGKGPIYNRYSVKRLCAELAELKERWPTQFIKFYDDMFILDRKVDAWLEEFAEVYPREVGLPFFCLTRANVLTRENLAALTRAGLHSLTMSIEAGNEYVRNTIVKRHMRQQQIEDAYTLCWENGIVTFANTILGIPVRKEIMAQQGKTAIDYDIESLDINIRCRVTYADFPVLHPYPGCELTEYAVKHGFFDGDFDKLFFSYQAESPFTCFTPTEALMQKNLSLLGPICVMFPNARWLRNVTVNVLMKLPLTKLYFFPWYLAKGYLNIVRVYPLRLSLWNLARNLAYSIQREWRKRSPHKLLYRKTLRLDRPTGQTLGGPPPDPGS